MNVASMVAFFKQNIDEIKKPKSLIKFNETDVPILELAGDIRLEQITPTVRKEVSYCPKPTF